MDGFSHNDRRQPLPPQQGEVTAPYGNGHAEENDEGNYPSDVSLLTSSVYSGQFTILNLSSVLGEGSNYDSDVDNNQILGDQDIAASPPRKKEDGSLPNTSLDGDKSREMVFADDEDQSWRVSRNLRTKRM
ncbi:MAG: hypothetical protein SGARI_006114 [Bacillariaceae sp.]